jgi:hypothetical protein
MPGACFLEHATRVISAVRHAAVVAALVAIACSATVGGQATASAIVPAVKSCGYLDTYIAIGAHDLGCRTARSVVRSYLRGDHHPLGYRCKTKAVNAGGGSITRCSKRSAYVTFGGE